MTRELGGHRSVLVKCITNGVDAKMFHNDDG